MANIIEKRKFICVDMKDANHNKIWNITIFDNDDVTCEWGRVGQGLQSKTHAGAGRRKFESLISEKTRPGRESCYTENKTIENQSSGTITASVNTSSLKEIARKQIKHSCPLVAEIIDYLTKLNAHQIYQATQGKITYNAELATFTTAQGIIMPDQVKEARDLLVLLADGVVGHLWNSNDFIDNLTKYLRLIPHEVGMKRIVPKELFPDLTAIQKENDILDGLEVSFRNVTNGTGDKNKDKVEVASEPKIFDVKMSLVEDRDVFNRIRQEFQRTKRDQHTCRHLDVKRAYEVHIQTMYDSFQRDGAKMKNVIEMYHGTKASNCISILSKGLLIPPSNASYCTGRLYGNGVYASPISSKSLGYSYGYWDGTRNERCFMFRIQMAMGRHYEPNGTGERLPKPGYDSTWARAGRSGVINDECIVYRTSQCNLTYLLEFTPGGK